MSFFGRQKRDLSDGSKSRDGEDTKKIKEGYEDINSIPDEVFEDGLSSPSLTKIVLNTLRNIEKQVKDLFALNEETKNSQIKGERQLIEFKKSIDFLSGKFDSLDKDRKEQGEKIKNLEEKLEKLEEENKSLNNSVDDLEQYSRRNCLLLHGVKETADENTDNIVIKTLSEELDVEITEEDLDRTHRVGKPEKRDGKSRPIIIKFARYAVRHNVYKNKKRLKGKNFLITESLTVKRVKALKAAQSKYGMTNV